MRLFIPQYVLIMKKTYWAVHTSKALEVHEQEILKAYLGVLTQFQSYRYQEKSGSGPSPPGSPHDWEAKLGPCYRVGKPC